MKTTSLTFALSGGIILAACQSGSNQRAPESADRQPVVSRAMEDLGKLQEALDRFATNNGGSYPDSLTPLVTPDVNGATYLGTTELPLDPWGVEYAYEPPGSGSDKARVFSYGQDGAPGGEGADADIVIHV